MATPNLALAHITSSQTNKETTANLSADGLDNAMNSVLSFAVTGSRIITASQLRSYHAFKLNGAPGASFTFSIPAGISRMFAVHNFTNQTCFIEIASDRSQAVSLSAGRSMILFSTGTEVYAYNAEVSTPYDIAGYVAGRPTDDECVLRFIAPRAITIATAFAGARAKARIASTGNAIFSIQRETSLIGSIAFNTTATGTFSTAGAGPGAVAAGEVVSIFAPPYRDASLSDIAITLAAVVA